MLRRLILTACVPFDCQKPEQDDPKIKEVMQFLEYYKSKIELKPTTLNILVKRNVTKDDGVKNVDPTREFELRIFSKGFFSLFAMSKIADYLKEKVATNVSNGWELTT